MDERNENIPTWTGRAVTTAEVARDDVELASRGSSTWNRADATKSIPDLGSARSEGSDVNPSEPGSHRHRRSASPGTGQSSNGMRAIPYWLIGVGLVVLMGAGGYYLLSRSGVAPTGTESAAEAKPPAEETGATSLTTESVTVESDDAAEPSTATEESAVSDSTEFDDVGEGSEQLDPDVLARYSGRAESSDQSAWALYENGVIYLEGRVPTEEYAKLLEDSIAAIGPGIVKTSANYIVDPTAPTPTDPPLFLPEAVRFVEDSVTIDPESQRVVNAAPFVVLSFFPEATITIVVAPTVGADGEINTALARERAEEISQAWQIVGLDPSQISILVDDAASPDSPDQGSAEFVVRNLLTNLTQ